MVTVGSFTPGIPLDREAACVFPRFRHVMGELHAEKMIHVGAEGLFDAQGYLRSQRGLAMQKVGERSATHMQNLRRLRDAQAESFDDFSSYPITRMERILHRALLMVIDHVDIASGVGLFVLPKDQPPVSGNS
jgi:hypothetical protein